MKQVAYALPIVALAWSPALAQQDPEYRTTTDTSAAGGIQIPPYEPERGPRAGSWEAALAGSGTSSDEFDNNNFGITGSLGYYVTSWMPVGVRQTANLSFGDDVVGDDYIGITRAFVDFQAPLGAFQPYIGGIIGAQYGKGIDDKPIYGPEAGLKYWVNESTFLFAQGEWQVVHGEAFKNANAVYAFGFGLNF
jgi:hypothetical protein